VSVASRILVLLTACAAYPFASARADPGKPSVRITVAAPEPAARGLIDAIRPALAPLPIEVGVVQQPQLDSGAIVHPPADFEQAVARIWVDASAQGRVTLYVVDGPWERILVRHVPLPNALDAVAEEQVATIVRYAVEALMQGATIGIRREELVEASDREPVRDAPDVKEPAGEHGARDEPPHQAQGRMRWNAGARYEAAMASSSEVLHGPGLQTDLAWQGPLSPSLGLSLFHRLPVMVEGSLLGARLSAVGIRGVASASTRIRPGVDVAGGLGMGTDLVYIQPRRVGEGSAEPEASRWMAVPVFRLVSRGSLALSRNAALQLSAGVDLHPVRTRYVVSRAGQEAAVFEPWQIQPFVALQMNANVADTGELFF